jgi:hypothetical protein
VTYLRTAAQRAADPARAKVFEAEVRRHLPGLVRDLTNATDDLDWCVWPQLYIDAKERHQHVGARWAARAPHVPVEDLFIIDELSYRRALRYWPAAWFLLRDVTAERLFMAWIVDVAVAERVRVQRVGKAKLLLDLKHFREIQSLDDVVPACQADIDSEAWRQSGAVGRVEVPQV